MEKKNIKEQNIVMQKNSRGVPPPPLGRKWMLAHLAKSGEQKHTGGREHYAGLWRRQMKITHVWACK